jgi:hypothetical protein
VQARPIPLYGLLPVRSNVSLAILLEAIGDMVQYFKGNDDRLRMEDLATLQRVLIAMSAAQNERKARQYLMALANDK